MLDSSLTAQPDELRRVARQRPGARGQRKTKTGCRVCKTRHKKCDEIRPACTQCITAGWRCDFLDIESRTLFERDLERSNRRMAPAVIPSSISTSIFSSSTASAEIEIMHLDYFYHVSLHDFSISFDEPDWQRIIIQEAGIDAIHHAALSISVLTRHNYHPFIDWVDSRYHSSTPQEYAMIEYGRAMNMLGAGIRKGLDIGIAVLASIMFVFIAGFQGDSASLQVHIRAGRALLDTVKCDVGVLHRAIGFMEQQVVEMEE